MLQPLLYHLHHQRMLHVHVVTSARLFIWANPYVNLSLKHCALVYHHNGITTPKNGMAMAMAAFV
jgi:hypothetical protein